MLPQPLSQLSTKPGASRCSVISIQFLSFQVLYLSQLQYTRCLWAFFLWQSHASALFIHSLRDLLPCRGTILRWCCPMDLSTYRCWLPVRLWLWSTHTGQSGEYLCETSDSCERLGKLDICQGSLAVSLLCVIFRASELTVVWTTDKMEFLGHSCFFFSRQVLSLFSYLPLFISSTFVSDRFDSYLGSCLAIELDSF